MTLIIDREAGEVRDKSDGTVIGSVDGPPWTKPDDAQIAVKNQLPNDDISISVQDLEWVLDAASEDVEWANPR